MFHGGRPDPAHQHSAGAADGRVPRGRRGRRAAARPSLARGDTGKTISRHI